MVRLKQCVRAFVVVSLLLLAVTPAMAAGKKITIALGSDALFLDPQMQNETVTNLMARHFYEAMVATDASGSKILPLLAESWNLADDNVTWTFNLRKGVKFSDGSDFTAEDVKFTMERATKNHHRYQVSTVKEIHILDPHTLKVVTKAPDGVFLYQMARLPILCKEYVTRVGDAAMNLVPVGTGPYKYDEWVKEDHIDMSLNPHYWGPKPAIAQVRFRPITNAATRTAALLTGEVDFAADIPVRDVQRVQQNKQLELITHPGQRLIYMHIDAHRSPTPGIALPTNPMTDLRVRQAISLAIDRSTIARVTMNRNAYPTGDIVSKGVLGNMDSPVPEFSIAKAKQLLKEAGWEKGFTVAIDAPNGRYPNDAQVAQAVASQLAKVGITVDLRLHPKSTFFDFVRPGDKSSIVMTGWAESIDAGTLCNVLFYTRGKNNKGASNRGHYSNAEFDDLLDEAAGTADLAKRKVLLEKAATILLRTDIGCIPLYFEQDIYGKKKNVTFSPRVDKVILAFQMDV